jgi:hypothetical protein
MDGPRCRCKVALINSTQFKGESGIWYAYQEPLGKVVRNGGYFLASKDYFRMGVDNSPEEAYGALTVERSHEIVKEYQPPTCK